MSFTEHAQLKQEEEEEKEEWRADRPRLILDPVATLPMCNLTGQDTTSKTAS